MKSFPMFIDVVGRQVTVVGSGEQAAQKTRLLLKTEADILVMGPDLDDELQGLVDAGRVRHSDAVCDEDALGLSRFAFVATGCAGADAAIAAVAKARGVLVNVVDRPELCDLTTPAIVDRDPVVVAIGTEGAAPVLARQIKTRLEEILEPRLGDLAALAARLRPAVAFRVAPERRRAFWRWVFGDTPRKLFARGREQEAARALKQAIEAGGDTEAAIDGVRAGEGVVSLVGAGPGSADLITLRGVQRLQEADVIFYDRLVEPRILELARRDAERVFVGKRANLPNGETTWPQHRINGVIVAAAKSGKRVVRLKCGDPLVFGRAAEEAAELEAAGVAWEVVPGVTAAFAAAAEAKFFPTERGVAQHFSLSTAHGAACGSDPDAGAAIAEGVTTAFYMGVVKAPTLQRDLLASGAPPESRVVIVERAETEATRRLETTLSALAETVASESVSNPAIIFVQHRFADSAQLSERAAVAPTAQAARPPAASADLRLSA